MAARAPDPLQTYRRRRDFAKTSEPAPSKQAPRGAAPIFVVQRHEATRLHYDFRLEWGGVLKSWAVPRGPSHDPAVKRLAVQTEDHPLEYATFEGDIPKGEYGGGHVDVWDHGTWTPEGDPEKAWRAGRMTFALDGQRLHGRWHLVRTRAGKGPQHWLLIKSHDAFASSGDDAEAARAVTANVASAAVARTARARASTLPPFVAPQLATLVSAAPPGTDWLYELKLDGYRILARADGDDVRLYTRNERDWTRKLPHVRDAVAALKLQGAWLDGELIATDESGHASFQALQQTIGEDDSGLQYWLFDAPFLDGEDLRSKPLHERKARLDAMLRAHRTAPDMIRFSRHLDGAPAELWRNACALGLEGLILKDPQAAYVGGRTGSWLKLKCRAEQEFVVGGYSVLADGRPDVSNVLLGYYERGALKFAGKVGTGFSLADARALKAKFLRARRAASPFADRVPIRAREAVTWLEPALVAQVAFAGWTADAHLRAPVFLGLREDKEARDVKRETTKQGAPPAGRSAKPPPPRRATAKRAPARAGAAPHGGTRANATRTNATRKNVSRTTHAPLTHPDRVLYPEDGVTKRELADYFEAVAPRLLPHLAKRPLSILRATDGDRPFFQKHPSGTVPDGIDTLSIDTGGSSGRREYFVCRNVRGLLGLAQLGAVELHTWGCSVPDPMRADRLTFDLDPDPALDWRTVADAALIVRGLLEDLGLTSFCKTTGGKGLHVVAPLTGRRPEWQAARAWSRAVADFVAGGLPDRFTSTLGAKNRQGRIFVDYLRNYAGATAVAAWSPRLRAGVPVSMPISWRDVEASEDLRATRFTLRDLASGRSLPRDAWAAYARTKQSLTEAALDRLRVGARGTRGRSKPR